MKIWILTLLVGSVLAAPSFEVHHRQTRNIASVLEKIIEETGIRDLLPWVQEMIQTDPDVQRFVEYLKSGKFEAILNHLRNCPGYAEVKDKLAAEGVDLVQILEKIRNFITGSGDVYYKIQPRNLGDILNEFIARLDLNRVIEVFNKYKNDPAIKKIIEFVQGDTMKGIVDCMKTSPEVKELKEKLAEEGIDIESLVEMIKMLVGNGYYIQPRTVGELLENLIQELGLRDLVPWIKEMIQTDPDVQRVVEYLKSDAFKRIEDHLRNCPGYKEVKDKLKAEGVDLVEILEKIRNFITGGSYHAKTVYYKIQPRRTLGELLEEILEKLDINRMVSIIKEKFHGNPDLKKVLDFLKSDTFHGIVECMRQSPDVQELVQKLNDEGIDVAGIIELIKSLLAEQTYYHVSSRTVGTLLEDLIDELGFRELIPWIKEMIETDPDVQRIVDYLRGPVFQNIENHLRNCPGYPEVRDKLKAEGVDLVEILQHIRDFFTGGSRHYYKIQPRRTLAELLAEVLERIDINRVLSVIQDKIKNDPDMKKVIDFVKGDSFKGIVDCMKESKDVQDLIEKLADEGIDVPGLVEMIKGVLGGM